MARAGIRRHAATNCAANGALVQETRLLAAILVRNVSEITCGAIAVLGSE